jgi:hypothetical protein
MSKPRWDTVSGVGEEPQGHCLHCDRLFLPATEAGYIKHLRERHGKSEDANQAAFRVVREATED